MLKLEAKNKNEEIILNYLNQNASESLAEKINTGKKTLSQCWKYIVSEAKKLAENNCACVDSDTVFRWAVHFFEEDSIKAEEQKPIPVKTVAQKPKPEPKKPQAEIIQLSLFDM
jgi:hypothetical protein